MNEEIKLQVQAYLDNEVSASEARKMASLLTHDPEAQRIYNELKDTKALLAGNELPVKLKEPRDFYWSQIRRGIETAETREVRPAKKNWMFRLFAPIAATAGVTALLLSLTNFNPGSGTAPRLAQETATLVKPSPEALHVIEPAPAEMSAITFHSDTEGVTVVWVSSGE